MRWWHPISATHATFERVCEYMQVENSHADDMIKMLGKRFEDQVCFCGNMMPMLCAVSAPTPDHDPPGYYVVVTLACNCKRHKVSAFYFMTEPPRERLNWQTWMIPGQPISWNEWLGRFDEFLINTAADNWQKTRHPEVVSEIWKRWKRSRERVAILQSTAEPTEIPARPRPRL